MTLPHTASAGRAVQCGNVFAVWGEQALVSVPQMSFRSWDMLAKGRPLSDFKIFKFNSAKNLRTVFLTACYLQLKRRMNGFCLKINICIFRRNKSRSGKSNHRQLFETGFFQFFLCSEAFV